MTTLAPSFLIGSSFFLQVTRTTIISQMGSKFGRIPPGTIRTDELAAFECLGKIPVGLQWEKCCDHSSALISEWIFFIFAGNKINHISMDEFEFQQDSITDLGVTCP